MSIFDLLGVPSILLCWPPMTESYLTTDIIVIVVLVVVLIIIGACAFCAHFYWTKIGVAEIWNTPKWSSMRSSFYRTVRRFSRTNSAKFGSERPFSAASAFSEDIDGSALPAPLRNKNLNISTNPQLNPSNIQSLPTSQNELKTMNIRQKSSNQVQPVPNVSYSKPVRTNYATKIGQPLEDTKIHNVHEYDDERNDGIATIETRHF